MPLPDSIAELVARFADNRSEYRKGDYNETQTRIDHVNPLFAALGWDMDNHEGITKACPICTEKSFTKRRLIGWCTICTG